MNKSYRNTVEIAEYANRIAGITDMELFQRHGAPVQEEEFTSRSEAFAEVLRTLERRQRKTGDSCGDLLYRGGGQGSCGLV